MAETNTVIEPSSATGASGESEWVPMSRGNIATKVAIAAMAAATLLTACTNPSDPGPVPATASSPAVASPTPTPSPTATAVAENAAILEAYSGYWTAMVRIFADPDPFKPDTRPNWDQLKQFAGDTAQADMFTTAYQLSRSGVVYRGTPTHEAAVTQVTPGQAAEIVDCVDSTNWQPVYASTGKPAAAPGQGLRVSTNSTMTFADGRWLVSAYTPDREKPC